MIVIEGPDGAGKSTLAGKLSAALNVPIHHSGGPARSAEEIYTRQRNMNASIARGERMIYDRAACISDPIYGRYLRGSSPFDDAPEYAQELRSVLRIPIIYCRPPTRHLLEIAGRPENKPRKNEEHRRKVKENASSIIWHYDISMGRFPHWLFDFTYHQDVSLTYDRLVQLIRQQIKDLL